MAPAPVLALAPNDSGSHYELRLDLQLDGWPATFTVLSRAAAAAARRVCRRRVGGPVTHTTAPVGTALEKGSAATIVRTLRASAGARCAADAGAGPIQCRASFPDKWLSRAVETRGHPGLIAMADSCYMWRSDGALHRIREALQRE
jgi:hypothetical protein